MTKFYGLYHDGRIQRFDTWEACEKASAGLSGFVLKSFKTEDAFKNWSDAQTRWRKDYTASPMIYTAFVDGSVKDIGGDAIPAYGVAIFDPFGVLVYESNGLCSANGAMTRNEAGELQAAYRAAVWAATNSKEILIVYDYEGICAYLSGTWEPKSDVAKTYVSYMKTLEKYIHGMKWIKGHGTSNDFLTRGNALADKLAGEAYDELSTR